MPDNITPSDSKITVTKAAGYVVVSWWQDRSGDGRRGRFEYEHHDTLNEALDAYREYQDGEYRLAAAMGIFACDGAGLPFSAMDPNRLIKLMAETRAS